MMAPEIASNSSAGCISLCEENVDVATRAGTGRDALFLALSRRNASLTSVSLSCSRSFSTSLVIGMGIVPVIHTGLGPCSEALFGGTMALNFGAVLKTTASDRGGEGDRAFNAAKSANDSVGVANRVGAVTNESSEIAGELEGSASVEYGVEARGMWTAWEVASLFARGGYGGFL